MHETSPLRRTVVKHDVPSRLLPENSRAIRVYLPPGYNELLSYPVVYGQDGEDLFNFGRIATTAQKHIVENDWEPFIIVGIDVDKRLRSSEYRPDGHRYSLYTRFVADELLPFVESTYAVRRTPDERLLVGDSLGGSVSLMLALERPDLFARVLSLSGAYYDLFQAEVAERTDLSDLAVWMTVGLQETAFATDYGTFDFVELNRNMRRLLEEKGATLSYSERSGEHKWGFWQQVIPEALGEFLGPDAWM